MRVKGSHNKDNDIKDDKNDNCKKVRYWVGSMVAMKFMMARRGKKNCQEKDNRRVDGGG